MVGEVGEGVSIGGGDDELSEDDARCRRASPRAPSMSPCRMSKVKKRPVKSMPTSK